MQRVDSRRQLPQRLLECSYRLPALDQMAFVEYHRRHRADAVAGVEALTLAHFLRIGVAGEDLSCAFPIEADGIGDPNQCGELGRAARRERVCQSVYVPRVAAAFNKKQTQTYKKY